MEIILSNASPKPIYEQITSQIKAMIMNGELKAGDPMPSMRKLAKELHVTFLPVVASVIFPSLLICSIVSLL